MSACATLDRPATAGPRFGSALPFRAMDRAARPTNDDSALLAALRRGDDAAFEKLVRDHSPHLLAVIRRIVRHEEDAHEALQDAFVSIVKSIDKFEGHSGLRTWLHRVAVNAALMKLRGKRRRPETALEDLVPRFQDDGHAVEPADPWEKNAVELAAQSEMSALVRELIDELPESYRIVLVLRDLEEVPTDEVARLLQVTPNAVKIRVHRARQALRTLLDRRLSRTARA